MAGRSRRSAAKYDVEITAAAEADLRDIHSWIARERPRAAARLVDALARQIAALESQPLRGAVIEESRLLGIDYRHLVYGPYRTIYRVRGKRVWIVRVLHGARLIGSEELEPGEE